MSSALTRNRLRRGAGFAAGVLLFYAPFALLVRFAGVLAPGSMAGTSTADVHTACVKMPLGWLVQPWMWGSLGNNPLYWLPIIVLPLAAALAGPLFCGWLCPAGALPEFLGRLVPERFKFDLKDGVALVPLRYGFLAGFLIAPFVTSSVCCTLCNFNVMQGLVSAATGNFEWFAYLTTMGLVSAVLWIVVLGVFTKGGRGWCLVLCPAGAVVGLASGLARRVPGVWRVRPRAHACTGCATCADVCPMRAISVPPAEEGTLGSETGDDAARAGVAVEQYLCNSCLDCVVACPSGALTFSRGETRGDLEDEQGGKADGPPVA